MENDDGMKQGLLSEAHERQGLIAPNIAPSQSIDFVKVSQDESGFEGPED